MEPTPKLPRGTTIEEDPDGITITVPATRSIGYYQAVGVLACLGLVVFIIVNPNREPGELAWQLPLTIGFVLVLAVPTTYYLINHSTIRLTRESLTFSHQPIPFPGRKQEDFDHILEFRTEQRAVGDRGLGSRFTVTVVYDHKLDSHPLFGGLDDPEPAEYICDRLTRFLESGGRESGGRA